jgi:hypothetical protein
MDLGLFEEVLDIFGQKLRAHLTRGGIGMNQGLHLTGGEPFLNQDLLFNMLSIAIDKGISSTFVETNCYWCVDDDIVEEKFKRLKEAGLGGVLVSVNPFLLEFVPLERVERAMRIGHGLFGRDLMIYHPYFYADLKRLGVIGRIKWEDYLQKMDDEARSHLSDFDVLLPMGRLVWRLNAIYRRFPPEFFFRENCLEELTRSWHVHVDNYGNYITGYCAGLSLGDRSRWDAIPQKGIDLKEHPVIGALASSLGDLCEYASGKYAFHPDRSGYVSKCHLCLHIRKHLVDEGCGLKELNPVQFYEHL